MKKYLLSICTVITIVAGGVLLSAQTGGKPCKPIPDGCTVTQDCKCQTNGDMTLCTDAFECYPA